MPEKYIYFLFKLSFVSVLFPVTERSKDTGLVYPVSVVVVVVVRTEKSKFSMKDNFSFKK